MRRLLSPRLILPLSIFFGVLVAGLRLGDLWQITQGGTPHAEAALAQTKDAAKPADAKAPDAKPDAANAGDKGATAEKADEKAANEAAAEEEFSPAEMNVLKQLAARRDELDRRAHDLDTREALLKVGEQRVDQKIKEMESLRIQMQGMVDQISGAQAAQLDNLVKIYETMKPAEAAKIFESLDMPVLLGVIQRMKPARSAPVLAAMAPDKAKEVTVALTKQDQLPKAK